MTRIATVLMTVVLVGAAAGAAPLTGLAQSPGGATAGAASAADGPLATADNEADDGENESVPPGAMLSGVIGVQEAEIEGEIETRAFDVRIARAEDNASRASVVATEVRNASERLEELRQRKEALRRARANGSMSDATFKAEMAELAARTETVKRLANRSEAVARGLPRSTLERNGVNTTAIDALRADAVALAGPEVAAIARAIAGPGVGKSIARGGHPGGRPGNVLHGNDTDGGGPPVGVPGRNGTDGAGSATDGGSDLPGNATNATAGNVTDGDGLLGDDDENETGATGNETAVGDRSAGRADGGS